MNKVIIFLLLINTMPINFTGGHETKSIRSSQSVGKTLSRHRADLHNMVKKWTEQLEKTFFNMNKQEKLKFDIDMNNKKLINLAEPSNPKDAVNKDYLDKQLDGYDDTLAKLIQVEKKTGKLPKNGKEFIISNDKSDVIRFGINIKIVGKDFTKFHHDITDQQILNVLGRCEIIEQKLPGRNNLILKCSADFSALYLSEFPGDYFVTYCYYKQSDYGLVQPN